jgi:phosphohistidine swiveling domain-containing protein
VGGAWVTDSEPNPRFRLYTRGNVGEVFPHALTPLTATLIGDEVQGAQKQLFLDMGVLRPHEATGPSVGTGVFGGYLYMNASAMRIFGVRMPGLSAADAEQQVTGTVGELPPYRREKGDRNLAATFALMRRGLRLLRAPDLTFLDEARRDAEAWVGTLPELATATDADLLAWLRTYPPRLGASMRRLLDAGMISVAPQGVLDQLVARRAHASPGLLNRLVAGTGEVDSAQPALRLWALGRVVAADAQLTAAFDAGLDGIEARTAGTPFARQVESFLHDLGHRGNDEYELASPAWSMDPRPVYASIDRLRHAPADRDPVTTAQRLEADAAAAREEAVRLAPRPLRRLVRRAVRLSPLGGIARERAKDILVLENLAARRALHELIRRGAARGGTDDVRTAFCLTIDELPRYLDAPAELLPLLEQRAAYVRYLDGRVPPAWFEGQIPNPSTWELRADAPPGPPRSGTTLTGIAVSSGRASGGARVIANPADPRGLEPGEVLVCAITDPSWTPLFLSASAVVCDTGAMLSHASIVARELGIPAVMSVAGITSVADGTTLEVDGDLGTVTIG